MVTENTQSTFFHKKDFGLQSVKALQSSLLQQGYQSERQSFHQIPQKSHIISKLQTSATSGLSGEPSQYIANFGSKICNGQAISHRFKPQNDQLMSETNLLKTHTFMDKNGDFSYIVKNRFKANNNQRIINDRKNQSGKTSLQNLPSSHSLLNPIRQGYSSTNTLNSQRRYHNFSVENSKKLLQDQIQMAEACISTRSGQGNKELPSLRISQRKNSQQNMSSQSQILQNLNSNCFIQENSELQQQSKQYLSRQTSQNDPFDTKKPMQTHRSISNILNQNLNKTQTITNSFRSIPKSNRQKQKLILNDKVLAKKDPTNFKKLREQIKGSTFNLKKVRCGQGVEGIGQEQEGQIINENKDTLPLFKKIELKEDLETYLEIVQDYTRQTQTNLVSLSKEQPVFKQGVSRADIKKVLQEKPQISKEFNLSLSPTKSLNSSQIIDQESPTVSSRGKKWNKQTSKNNIEDLMNSNQSPLESPIKSSGQTSKIQNKQQSIQSKHTKKVQLPTGRELSRDHNNYEEFSKNSPTFITLQPTDQNLDKESSLYKSTKSAMKNDKNSKFHSKLENQRPLDIQMTNMSPIQSKKTLSNNLSPSISFRNDNLHTSGGQIFPRKMLTNQSSLLKLQQNGIDPFSEHRRIKKRINFPINPAFLKTSQADRRLLQSLNAYCRAKRVPLTNKQESEYKQERAREEFQHFTGELDRIVEGHRDGEFLEALIDYVMKVQLAEISEEEKNLFLSEQMQGTSEGKRLKEVIEEAFALNQKVRRDQVRNKLKEKLAYKGQLGGLKNLEFDKTSSQTMRLSKKVKKMKQEGFEQDDETITYDQIQKIKYEQEMKRQRYEAFKKLKRAIRYKEPLIAQVRDIRRQSNDSSLSDSMKSDTSFQSKVKIGKRNLHKSDSFSSTSSMSSSQFSQSAIKRRPRIMTMPKQQSTGVQQKQAKKMFQSNQKQISLTNLRTQEKRKFSQNTLRQDLDNSQKKAIKHQMRIVDGEMKERYLSPADQQILSHKTSTKSVKFTNQSHSQNKYLPQKQLSIAKLQEINQTEAEKEKSVLKLPKRNTLSGLQGAHTRVKVKNFVQQINQTRRKLKKMSLEIDLIQSKEISAAQLNQMKARMNESTDKDKEPDIINQRDQQLNNNSSSSKQIDITAQLFDEDIVSETHQDQKQSNFGGAAQKASKQSKINLIDSHSHSQQSLKMSKMPRNTQKRISKLFTIEQRKSNRKLNRMGLHSSSDSSSRMSCDVSSQHKSQKSRNSSMNSSLSNSSQDDDAQNQKLGKSQLVRKDLLWQKSMQESSQVTKSNHQKKKSLHYFKQQTDTKTVLHEQNAQKLRDVIEAMSSLENEESLRKRIGLLLERTNERVELDRQFLIREKTEVIIHDSKRFKKNFTAAEIKNDKKKTSLTNEEENGLQQKTQAEYGSLEPKEILLQRKRDRLQKSRDQKQLYKLYILHLIRPNRIVDFQTDQVKAKLEVQAEEVKFASCFQVILNAGWQIQDENISDILDICGIDKVRQRYWHHYIQAFNEIQNQEFIQRSQINKTVGFAVKSEPLFDEIEEKIARKIPQSLTIILQSTLLFLCQADLRMAHETIGPARVKEMDSIGKVFKGEIQNLIQEGKIPQNALLCEYHLIRLRQILATNDQETFIGDKFMAITNPQS